MNITIGDSLSIKRIGEEIFIFDRKLSRIHTFNKVGSFIWEQISTKENELEIANAIVQHYEIDSSSALKDVREFIKELEEKHIISFS